MSDHQYPLDLGHFIDGRWRDADNVDRIDVRDPCDCNRLVGTVAISAAVVAAIAVISKTVANEKAADDAHRASD